MATKSWRDVLPIHPAANFFPLMAPDELKDLGEDIKKNGLTSPIVLWSPGDQTEKDQPVYLLDGRNRLDAMEAAGLKIINPDGSGLTPPNFFPYNNTSRLDGWTHHLHEKRKSHAFSLGGGFAKKPTIRASTDPYQYVLSANIHRRHLTPEQKRELIAEVLKANPEKSNRQVAEMVKDDHKKVGRVRNTLEATGALPQLGKTVGKDGKARKQPVKKKRRTEDDFARDLAAQKSAMQPERRTVSDDSNSGVPETRPTPEERTSGFPTGSVSEEPPADQAAVAETKTQPANLIIWTWDNASDEKRQEFVKLRRVEFARVACFDLDDSDFLQRTDPEVAS